MHGIDTRPGAGPGEPTIDNFQGSPYGAGVSLIFEDADQDGAGPFLHQHPYSETVVIHAGRAMFTVGAQQRLGEACLVLVVPELTLHKFQVIGPRALHFHPHPRQRHLHHPVAGGAEVRRGLSGPRIAQLS